MALLLLVLTSGPLPLQAQVEVLPTAGASSEQPSPTALKVAMVRYGFVPDREGGADQGLDIVLVLPEREPRAWRVPLTPETFANYLAAAYRSIAVLQPTPGLPGQPDPLYTLLVAPISAALEEEAVTTLLISADRGLQAVPFAALHDGKRYLGDRFSFSITPSLALTPLSIPDAAADQPAGNLAFASTRFASAPPLLLAGTEIKRIASDVGNTTTYEDEKFTATALKAGILQSSTRNVHVASHAEFAPDGAYVLTGDGKITLNELYQLDRGAGATPLELVYLSACRTALGSSDAELGFSGLALQIGASSAVGSLWNVNDLGSAAFAVMFYRHLRTGLIKAEAALAARQAMIRGQLQLKGKDLYGPFPEPLLTDLSRQHQDLVRLFPLPYYWAGYTVLGSPW